MLQANSKLNLTDNVQNII